MPSAAAPAALDGVPASFVRGYIDNLRRRKRVRAPSAELAAEHALAIRTAFRLELSLPLPDAPAIDSATAEVIARMRDRFPELLGFRPDDHILHAYGADDLLRWAGQLQPSHWPQPEPRP